MPPDPLIQRYNSSVSPSPQQILDPPLFTVYNFSYVLATYVHVYFIAYQYDYEKPISIIINSIGFCENKKANNDLCTLLLNFIFQI